MALAKHHVTARVAGRVTGQPQPQAPSHARVPVAHHASNTWGTRSAGTGGPVFATSTTTTCRPRLTSRMTEPPGGGVSHGVVHDRLQRLDEPRDAIVRAHPVRAGDLESDSGEPGLTLPVWRRRVEGGRTGSGSTRPNRLRASIRRRPT